MCSNLVGIPIEIVISAVGLILWAMNAGVKKFKSMIKKKKKKHKKIILLAKAKLNSIGVPTSKALTGWYISEDEFA